MTHPTTPAAHCEAAGYHILGQVVDILTNRETLSDAALLRFSLDAELLSEVYDTIIGPAIDQVESLLVDREFTAAIGDAEDTGMPREVVWADEDGQFILRDGSFGNPGCDDCGSEDAVARADGVYLCSTAAADRALTPPTGGWQRITVTETVRAWGFETSTYQTMYSIDQIRARVAADTGEDATDSAVAEWLSENLIPVESDLELQEILDRDSLEITTGTRKPPTGVGVRV